MADRGEGRSGQTGARNLSGCFCLGRGRGRVDDGATTGGRRGRAGGADRRRLGGQSHRRQDLLDGRFGLDEGDEAQGTAAGVADAVNREGAAQELEPGDVPAPWATPSRAQPRCTGMPEGLSTATTSSSR